MRIMATVLLLLTLGVSAFAESIEGAPQSIFETSINPCSFWSSNSSGSGYVCFNRPRTLRVVEARYIRDLERRVEALESRLQQLEEQ